MLQFARWTRASSTCRTLGKTMYFNLRQHMDLAARLVASPRGARPSAQLESDNVRRARRGVLHIAHLRSRGELQAQCHSRLTVVPLGATAPQIGLTRQLQVETSLGLPAGGKAHRCA